MIRATLIGKEADDIALTHLKEITEYGSLPECRTRTLPADILGATLWTYPRKSF